MIEALCLASNGECPFPTPRGIPDEKRIGFHSVKAGAPVMIERYEEIEIPPRFNEQLINRPS